MQSTRADKEREISRCGRIVRISKLQVQKIGPSLADGDLCATVDTEIEETFCSRNVDCFENGISDRIGVLGPSRQALVNRNV